MDLERAVFARIHAFTYARRLAEELSAPNMYTPPPLPSVALRAESLPPLPRTQCIRWLAGRRLWILHVAEDDDTVVFIDITPPWTTAPGILHRAMRIRDRVTGRPTQFNDIAARVVMNVLQRLYPSAEWTQTWNLHFSMSDIGEWLTTLSHLARCHTHT